jgi:hypothetical protein
MQQSREWGTSLSMGDWHIRQLLPEPPQPPLEPDRGGYTLTMRECEGSEAVAGGVAVRGC